MTKKTIENKMQQRSGRTRRDKAGNSSPQRYPLYLSFAKSTKALNTQVKVGPHLDPRHDLAIVQLMVSMMRILIILAPCKPMRNRAAKQRVTGSRNSLFGGGAASFATQTNLMKRYIHEITIRTGMLLRKERYWTSLLSQKSLAYSVERDGSWLTI